MKHWFVWQGKNSLSDFGLWISKLPPIVRAKERYTEEKIPGRAGSLILLEGDDIYDNYLKECVVTARNSSNIQPVLDWLSGSGELVFSNEIDKAYIARISAQVSFQRISNDLSQATIPFYVEPFKKNRYSVKDKITAASASSNIAITNPGDVASKPKVKITKSSAASNLTVTIGGQAMTFKSFTGEIVVDCSAGIVMSGNDMWTGKFTGDFWKIPVGSSTIVRSAACALEIEPEWRWK